MKLIGVYNNETSQTSSASLLSEAHIMLIKDDKSRVKSQLHLIGKTKFLNVYVLNFSPLNVAFIKS